jgi:hypothetical protein
MQDAFLWTDAAIHDSSVQLDLIPMLSGNVRSFIPRQLVQRHSLKGEKRCTCVIRSLRLRSSLLYRS